MLRTTILIHSNGTAGSVGPTMVLDQRMLLTNAVQVRVLAQARARADFLCALGLVNVAALLSGLECIATQHDVCRGSPPAGLPDSGLLAHHVEFRASVQRFVFHFWRAEMQLWVTFRRILGPILELTRPREQGQFVSALGYSDWQDVVFIPLQSDVICHAITNIVVAQAPDATRITIQRNGIVRGGIGRASSRHMFAAAQLSPLQRVAARAARIGLIPLAAASPAGRA